MAKDQSESLDPIWQCGKQFYELVDLRLHVTRLYFVADELRVRCGDPRWSAVSENLHLAASLRNVRADTDLTGSSYMCGGAADFDEAMSKLAERHLAGIIVFNLCWSAYEGTVELASNKSLARTPKGARGRDILRAQVADAHFPWLRQCLMASLVYVEHQALTSHEMRDMISQGMLAGVAAESLRLFRNNVAHGTLVRPEPKDWGEGSYYDVDSDPDILKFHYHIRLLLILIQMMMLRTDIGQVELSLLADDWLSAPDLIKKLHCSLDLDADRVDGDDPRLPQLQFDFS